MIRYLHKSNKPKLSILIAHIASRAFLLEQLLYTLNKQLTPQVEVLLSFDDGKISIGKKRNELLLYASPDGHICFLDDDDTIHADYVSEILNALKSDPDVVSFIEEQYHNGIHYKTRYLTLPNILHLNPIRATIAKTQLFQDTNCGEDKDWCKRLLPLIKTEYFINKPLYNYMFVSPNKRSEITNTSRLRDVLREKGLL